MADLATNTELAQAYNHFGLGARPDDSIQHDPASWLMSQLKSPDPTPVAGLPTTADGLTLVQQYTLAAESSATRSALASQIGQTVLNETQALYVNAVTTIAPFRERLVWFWFNHFVIMAGNTNAVVPATAGPYIREVIRPHVTGNFSDMLVAAMHHPAMLYSLNNDQNYGPASPWAISQAKIGNYCSINENLARETLELFTLGANGGYTQADVDALAYLYTGFKVSVEQAPLGFSFEPMWAQPGQQTLLGRQYASTDAGCTAALRALAANHATANHIATKLVTHFVSDNPNSADIATVAQVFLSTGGNLLDTTTAVIGLASAWQELTKLRTPSELLISVMRAVGMTAAQVPYVVSTLQQMGSAPFCSDFPNGWSDLGADWCGSEQMLLRVNWLYWLTVRLGQRNLASIVESTVAPFISKSTLTAVTNGTTVAQQLLILFSSPEFQRR